MLDNLARFFALAAFVAVAALLGLLLWQSLFGPEIQNKPVKTENAQTEQNRPEKNFDGVGSAEVAIAKYTRLLAVFTALLVLVSIFQIAFLIKAENIAEKTANAAKQSADIAKDALIIGNRAFVMPNGSSFLWHKNEDDSVWWEIGPIWFNAGNTRTDSLRVTVNSYFEDTVLPDDWQFPPHPGESTEFFLGPKQSAGSDPIIKTGPELAAVKDGTKNLYIWGIARYRDVFPDTPDHLTRFAWQVFIFGDPTKPGTGDAGDNVVRITRKLLKKHNCADDECAKQSFP